MSEIKLLPCPFCGGEAMTYKTKSMMLHDLQFGVMCKDTPFCCIMSGYKTEEEAVAAWNTRKPVDDVLNDINAEIDSSDKYIMEYDDSIEQKAFNSGMRKILKIVKEGLMLEVEE